MSTLGEILEVFGGSLFPEDCRADLQSVYQRLESTRPTEEVYGEANASHDLLFSFYHAFCGDNKKAFSTLTRISDHLDSLPRRWRLRCLSYRIYHLSLRRYPPIIRFRSELSSLSACMYDSILSWEEGQKLMGQVSQVYAEVKPELQSQDELEVFMMIQLVGNNLVLWRNAFEIHSAHPEGSWSLPQFRQNNITSLRANVPHFQKLITTLIQTGHHRLMVNVALRQVQVLAGCGNDDDVRQMLPQILEHSSQHDDKIGQALCKMSEADMIMSPPFSNPIALNLIALDGDGYNCENRLWDNCEDTLGLRADPKADQLYTEALNLFQSSGSPIGCASIKLRQATVLLARILDGTMSDTVTYQVRLMEVEEHLSEVLSLCGRDGTFIQIVKGHQTILAILKGANDDANSLMSSVGIWGKQNNNECIANFVGFLVVRSGRRLWKDQNRIDIALACCICAQALFECLGNPVAVFQAINERAELHDELKDSIVAKQLVNKGIDTLDEVLAEIDLKIANPKSDLMRDSLPAKRHSLLISYDAFVGRVLHQSRDTKELQAWRDRVATWNLSYSTSSVNTTELLTQSPKSSSWLRAIWTGITSRAYRLLISCVTWLEVPFLLRFFSLRSKELGAMSRMFFPPSYQDKTTEELYKEAEMVGLMAKAYRDAFAESGEYFTNFDVDKGTEVLKTFCSKTETMSLPWTKKATHCVLASFINGDPTASMRYLSHVSEADDRLEIASRPVFVSQATWCRSKYDRRLRNQTEAENLLARCAMANSWDRGARFLRSVEEASPGFLDPAGPDTSVDHWKRCVWAGLIAEHAGELQVGLQRYVMAEEQLVTRRNRSIGPDAKISSLSALAIGELYTGLTRLCVKCSKAQIPIDILAQSLKYQNSIGTWEQAALWFLERGRAQSLLERLSQTHRSDASQGQMTDITLIYKKRLRMYLEAFLSTNEDEDDVRQELAELNTELSRLEAEPKSSRSEPVIEPKNVAGDLYTCLDRNSLLIELTFSGYESVFIAATASGIQFTGLSGLRRQQVRDPVYRVMKSINDYKTAFKNLAEDQSVTKEMETITSRIASELEKVSNMILDPIADLIRSHSHLVFSTGHPFVAFPFAALPFDGKPLFLSTAISSTPSLAVYAKLSSQRSSFRPKVATIVKTGLSTKEEPLPLAAIESMLIANDFNTWPHKSNRLSDDKFSELMQGCTIAHIGTHGAIHSDSPWLSYISLKRRFRVIDLSNIQSKAALVVFAACQSGLGKAEGDEMLGFANGVLQTGAMAYLGSLWEVSDAASMMLMIYFYRAIKIQPTTAGRTLAELWKVAMSDFYYTGEAKARTMIDELIEELDRCKERGRNPDKLLRGAKEELESLRDEMIVDFKHPYFYASFAMTGFGGLVCEVPESDE